MEPNGNEKDNLRGAPGFAAHAAPPPYGAFNTPAPQSEYYPGAPHGSAMPGQSGFPQLNPRYQGYSPLNNEDVRIPVSVRVTRTTIVTPVLINPPDYLCTSIITMLCCCLPLGVVALVFSLKTQDCNARGDVVGAMQNSQTARTLNRVAFAVGFFIFVIYVTLGILLIIIPNQIEDVHPTLFPPFHIPTILSE